MYKKDLFILLLSKLFTRGAHGQRPTTHNPQPTHYMI